MDDLKVGSWDGCTRSLGAHFQGAMGCNSTDGGSTSRADKGSRMSSPSFPRGDWCEHGEDPPSLIDNSRRHDAKKGRTCAGDPLSGCAPDYN
jgi:hypothetical protein